MTRGLTREELRPCDQCTGQLGMGVVYRVTVETHVLDPRAVQKVAGLETMLGGSPAAARVADALSPVSAFSDVLGTATRVICIDCAARATTLDVLESQPCG